MNIPEQAVKLIVRNEGSIGNSPASVEAFRSKNGGHILRLSISSEDCSFILPYAKNTKDGIEIHLSGRDEVEFFVETLTQVLRRL